MRSLFLMSIALVFVGSVAAQTMYRWKDPSTGRIVVSDKPPPAGIEAKKEEALKEVIPEPTLPYATKQAAAKYPVVFYTAESCGEACELGRAFLKKRNVPFQEKLVKTQDDIETLKNTFGSSVNVPCISVGRQTYVGFNETKWDEMLDLATYPKAP